MEGEEWLIMGVVSARCRPGRGRGRGWGGSVLSIHDPWCYTLSCNTCVCDITPSPEQGRDGAGARRDYLCATPSCV